MNSREALIDDIRRRVEITDADLAAVLAGRTRSDRFETCWQLAVALAEAGQHRQSRLLARRALGLWGGEEGFVDAYLDMARGDADAKTIRAVSKRAGMRAAERGDLMSALRYFNIRQYAYQSTGGGDRYRYDPDILRAIEVLAGVPTAAGLPRRKPPGGDSRPLRIAYLVFGATHTGSVLIRLLQDFARCHDQSGFECRFYTPDVDIPQRRANAALIDEGGAELIAVDSTDEWVCLVETSRKLRAARPDILVSVAALADYRYYYLFAACPAAFRVALCYGPPAQYVPPTADWVIAATRHPFIDSPCDGEVVPIEVRLPTRPTPSALPDGERIPEGAVVLLAAGRSEKFLCRDYWQAMLDVLIAHPECHFIVCGLASRPPFLAELLAGNVGARVHVFGWLANYHGLLVHADIVVDTFPSGGGLTIIDAMAFGIPVISFANNELEPYDQVNWNLGEELIDQAELIVPRADFAELVRRLTRLIANEDLRARLGASCRAHVEQTRGNPERMVRRIEASYRKLAATGSRGRMVPPPLGRIIGQRANRLRSRLRARLSEWRLGRWLLALRQ